MFTYFVELSMGYPYIYVVRVRAVKKKSTKICGNTSQVSPHDEVAENAHIAGMHSQSGIKSIFVNSREVPLCKLAQVRFISATVGWS